MMSKTPLPLLLLLALGCSGAPDQPGGSYRLPAVSLRLRLQDPPPGMNELIVSLEAIPYCSPFSPSLEPDGAAWEQIQNVPVPIPGGTTEVRAVFASFGSERALCPLSPPLFRFYRITGYASSANHLVAPGTFLAYSPKPGTYVPFGPTGPQVSLPQGYSWLQRTCDGAEVRGLDQVVNMQTTAGPLSYGREQLEIDEAAFEQQCQRPRPPEVLGRRVSLDSAVSIAWSPDGNSLYYAVSSAQATPEQASSLRAVPAAGGTTVELATGPFDFNLHVTTGGDILFWRTSSLERVHPQPDGTSTREVLSVPRGQISPDGRWLVSTTAANGGLIQDLTTQAVFPFEHGTPVAWSPDSRWLALDDAGQISLLNVETHAMVVVGSRDSQLHGPTWLPDGRLVLLRPDGDLGPGDRSKPSSGPASARVVGIDGATSSETHFTESDGVFLWAQDHLVRLVSTSFWNAEVVDWNGQLSRSAPVAAGFNLEDPTVGRVSEVIRPGAGALPWDPLGVMTGPDYALVWARRCKGLFETVCTSDLHRISLVAGTDTVVVTSVDQTSAQAVSPDGKHVAYSVPSGIFIQDLP
jgi:hypothetical protein